MKILVINSGSSSLKYQLFFMDTSEVLASGLVERIGEGIGSITHKFKDQKIALEKPVSDHGSAIEIMIDLLTSKETGVISDKSEITAVGHRVVHGGEKFKEPTLINENALQAIKEHEPLAPLHNPANLTGILACKKFFGSLPQVAVFDTAFHQSIPEHAFLYAIDYNLYKDHGVRRYGFHGTSHKYVANRGAKFLNKPIDNLNLITIHLGNGSSIAAIENGKSVDTTMGLTPLEGIVMGTRSGDIDPGIIFYLSRELNKSLSDIESILNKQSGLKGLSGTNDMRDLLSKKSSGDKRAEVAFLIYAYRIKKYIGAYAAAMGKLDGIIFTGGIGE
ncbi:MAG: acetate kinase, partial [Leptospiraceae bacterium]|nr:acetate kinase [Leptospiraceae bacterium]